MASHLLLFFWFLLQIKFSGQEEEEAREMKYTSKDTGLEQALRSPDEDEAKLLNSVSSRMRVSMAEARDSCTGISRKLLVGLGFAALLIQESRAVLGRERIAQHHSSATVNLSSPRLRIPRQHVFRPLSESLSRWTGTGEKDRL